MAAESRWRTISRQVIRETLERLPAGVSEADRRRAVRDAYPFGERAMFPYKCWLSEVRKVLGRRVKKHVPAVRPGVAFRFWDRGGAPKYCLWLVVACGWCEGKVAGGCLQCVSHHHAIARVVDSLEFRALREDAAKDATVLPLLKDWLEERGIVVE